MFSILPPGVWASKVGRMAGVKVPLVAMHHAYVVTERIEGIQVSDGAGELRTSPKTRVWTQSNGTTLSFRLHFWVQWGPSGWWQTL